MLLETFPMLSFSFDLGEMCRIIFLALFATLSNFALSLAGESCTIPRTGETGECIFFIQCPHLLEQYKRDRTLVPAICSEQRRTICCPRKIEIVTQAPTVTSSIESRFSGPDPDASTVVELSIIKTKCNEYRRILLRNITSTQFVLGEPPVVTSTAVCHQKKEDVGVASELEFPHLAIIKLTNRQGVDGRPESKCIGSLISASHVITSVHCVSSDIKHVVSVQLGAYRFEETNEQNYEVDEIETKYGLAILKLKQKVELSERVVPICLFPDQETTDQSLLVGWSGDWRDCDPKLKKWIVRRDQIENSSWQLKINASVIMNYRETLLAGAPLQIYHPDSTCQYSLIGVFEQLTQEQYAFNKLHKKLRWIENVVWPRQLNQISAKTYRIIKKGLRF